MQTLQTNLKIIAQYAEAKAIENDEFIAILQQQNTVALDILVNELNNTISPKIDCTACGNCCKTLMINVEEDEANRAATALQISRTQFDETFIEKSESGVMLINTIPCHFLSDNKCTIYESRFAGCKEFPALHLPNFNKRLFTIFMHYNRCPIIFNVIEKLKVELKNLHSK